MNGLWGEAYVKAAHENARAGRPPIVIEWRASAANQAAMEKNAVAMGAAMGADVREWAESAAKGIAAARAAGKPAYSENDDDPPAKATELPAPASKTRVFFLTDATCTSACLDFADLLHTIPGVVHVGLPTNADTPYMEVRPAPLPSGLGTLVLSMKVWRNRPRGKQPYIPAHRFPGDISDTRAVEAWISGL